MLLRTLIATLLCMVFTGCNELNKNCSLQYVGPDKNIYNIRGCLVDSLEHGAWSIYDSRNVLLESGSFDKGVRVGPWYYSNGENDSIITWRKYSVERLQISTNIPTDLHLVEDSPDYVKFSNLDSTNLLNLVITIHDLTENPIDVNTYYKQGETKIQRNGWTFTVTRDKMTSKSRDLYLNEYSINTIGNEKFTVLNCYGTISTNKLAEVSCRFTQSSTVLARNIFFSVISNAFIGKRRFINPFEEASVEY